MSRERRNGWRAVPDRTTASLLAAVIVAPCFSSLRAQSWNSSEALALVRRAQERRSETQADASLTSYRTRAHGFVFFLAQVGEGLSEPPRLVKADELDVEVYWQAPDRSKQVILGWRDGAFLPTDIEYHRDHLGIVTNNFGDLIRIGEGDEVRDVVHPLSPAGPGAYDYALGDSLAIRTAGGEVHGPRSAGTAPLVRAAARGRHALSRRRDRRAGAVPLQLHAARVSRPPARGHQHRAGERALRGPLLAALPPGGRDPPADHLARLSGARDHPRPLGDRRLRLERAAPAGDLRRARDRRAAGARSLGRLALAPSRSIRRSRASRRRSTRRTWTRCGWKSSGSPAPTRSAGFPPGGWPPARSATSSK